MKSIQRAAVAIAACASLFHGAASPAADAPQRPRDPWVFRSALDGHARMLTVALSDKLYITYDTQHASLARAWHDGVNFTGGVYDARHGPQPTSIGKPYFKAPENAVAWTATQNGKPVDAKPRYAGYSMHENRVSIRFTVDTPAGRVTIDESPDVGDAADGVSLVRTFTVSNLPEGTTLTLTPQGSPGDWPVAYDVVADGAAPATPAEAKPTTQPAVPMNFSKNGTFRVTTTWRQS